ncbi:MAG: pitrilysin family protein [Bdellovibrionota bacterium]
MKYQLKNGLTVLLRQNDKAPVVSVQVWVKTGSADEKKGEEGISHFIEHLVFKGTSKYKVGEIANLVENAGGEMNAYTSFDQTVFYITLSRDSLELGMDILSEMMGRPLFEKAETDREREVVIEEIRRDLDSPERQLGHDLFSTMYKKHPYGKPVIGFTSNIKKFSIAKIRGYFEKHYQPKNMLLVVTGDFETADCKRKVLKYFGDLKPSAFKRSARPKEAEIKSPRIVIKKVDFEKTQAYLTWRIPHQKHKDVPALELLSMALGQGDTSLLVDELRLKKGIVDGIGSFVYSLEDGGLFGISFRTKPELVNQVIAEISRALGTLVQRSLTQDEFARAYLNLSTEQIYSIETVDGMARMYGSMMFSFGDPDHFAEYLKQVKALKPADIQRVASKYLDPGKLSFILHSKAVTPAYAKEVKKTLAASFSKKPNAALKKDKVNSSYKVKTLKMPKGDRKTHVITEVVDLSPGLNIILRHQPETPTVSVRMGLRGGLRYESQEQLGITELLSRSWALETKRYNEQEMNKLIEDSAAGLSAFGGRNTFGLQLDCLEPYLENLIPILGQIVREPLFSDSVLEREKSIILRQIKLKADNPSQIAVMKFLETIFPGHPYGRDSLGNETSLAQLNSATIRAHYEKLLSQTPMTISVVGSFDKEKVLKLLQTEFGQFRQGFGDIKVMDQPVLMEKNLIKNALQKEQTHILYGFPTFGLKDSRKWSLHLIQSILAGMGGRLFNELREKNSLAYSVSPVRMEGLDGGYFGVYIGCAPDKTEKSLELIQKELDRLKDEKVPHDEIERGKNYIVGRHNIDLQRKSSIAQTLLLDHIYGTDLDEAFHVDQLYRPLSQNDIQQSAQLIFSRPPVVSIVGPGGST